LWKIVFENIRIIMKLQQDGVAILTAEQHVELATNLN
jgi:hypothetical protein